MTPRNVLGTCLLCRTPVSKRGALRHVEGCLRSTDWPAGIEPSFLIRIQGRYEKAYWLVVLAHSDATLGDLDRLIRDVWVDCCGHMSAFSIGDETYLTDDDGKGMAVPLSRLLSPECSFSYRYDFGSTTHLDLKVIGTTPAMPPKSPLCLLMRNSPPPIACGNCGDEAAFCVDGDEYMDVYCRKCIHSADADPDCVEIIYNSPRWGVCGYVEDYNAAIRWYPPGWSAEEIATGDLQEILNGMQDEDALPFGDEDVHAILEAVSSDIGQEVDGFIEAEQTAYGEQAALLAKETVLTFCIFMYGFHGKPIGEWDETTVRTCLVEEMAANPVFPEEWLDNAVPILCRFLSSMKAGGRVKNATELIAVFKEAEPNFRAAATSREKYQSLSRRILAKAIDEGVDTDDLNSMADFVMREVISMAGMDPDDNDLINELMRLFNDSTNILDTNEMRNAMILERCEEFCSRLEDITVPERCKALFDDLAAHPAAPLSRGDAVLWSAAIAYAACRDAGLIRRGRGGTPLASDICCFFDLKLSSVRSKVRSLNKYVPDRWGA